ncbi:acyl-coenzyme A thioesterase 3-like [Notothenia coriiceps]|uniref:Acyl-coenzyme A thioesterase 3-like n=1 Tax=Notothenia coriiceps TaxID=8208 RepID=A0A6I9MR17_9TELE|nr:PREDICTED: acyl-coenzyme A thioesterase 3-like [Notothenia coriiceps]
MSSQVRLRLLPRARCMFDEPVHVKVAGLRSRQVVTLRARATDEKGVMFSSMATYKADGSGEVDLQRDPSLSGTYTGVQPMGLLWSMRPDTLHKRFTKTCSLNPQVVKFSVHEEEEGGMLAEATNERLLVGDGVIRHPVKDGNIRGVLFTPPGEGPFPAVLDLYTFGGGLSEKRASLLHRVSYQVTQFEGEVMDEASGLQQSSADLFQNVSECLSTRSLLQIQTEEFRAVKSAEATEKLGKLCEESSSPHR